MQNITEDEINATRVFVKSLLKENVSYPKAELMAKLLKYTNNNDSRARRGFYLMVKSKSIYSLPCGSVRLTTNLVNDDNIKGVGMVSTLTNKRIH